MLNRFWLVILTLCALAQGRGLGRLRDAERRDSLPPRIQYYYKVKGEYKLPFEKPADPESLNIHMVGKWGRGPAACVTGRDSLVFVAMGSEVAVFNCVNAGNPRVISEIQCRFIVHRVILRDTLLYAVLQSGVEVFSIANPANVTKLKYLPVSAIDMCIQDSLAYTINTDSFTVYRIVSPESLARVGACSDSGHDITTSQGFAYVCGPTGLYVIDATDPTNPSRASTLSAGSLTGAAWVESGTCYYTQVNNPSAALVIADVTDPYHPVELGRKTGIGGGDIYKIDFFVYLPGFQIVDVGQPGNPTVISSLTFEGYHNGVWTRSPYSYSFVADGFEGLAAININDPVNPVLDTTVAGTDASWGVSVSGRFAFVSNDHRGMKDLDLGIIAAPREVGSYDTTAPNAYVNAVHARETLAYLATEQWPPFRFRAVNVTRPEAPSLLGGCLTWNRGVAIAVRDTLAYVAENAKLEIFSIANPRQPRLVGSCGLVNGGGGLCLQDTFAYVASDLNIINVANPANPRLVSRTPSNCWSVAVQDTFAFLSHAYESLCVFNIADPVHPYEVGWARLNGQGYDVVVSGNRAYVGCYDFRVFDISDPAHPIEVGRYETPYRVRRVFFDGTYVYAACFGAGVCIFETTSTTGVADKLPCASNPDAAQLRIVAFPNPARNGVELRVVPPETRVVSVTLTDATGRKLVEERLPVAASKAHLVLPDDRMPPGVYFVAARSSTAETTIKLVKQ
jgi:hypothetical protein